MDFLRSPLDYRLRVTALASSVPEEKYVAKHRDFLDGFSHWLQKSGWDLNFFVSSIESLHLQWQYMLPLVPFHTIT